MKNMIIICLSLLFVSTSMAEDMKAVGESYIAFLQEVGRSDGRVTPEAVSALFAPDCQKIENGTVLFRTLSAFPDQLRAAHKTVGKWTVTPIFMTTSAQDKTCTLQFVWKGEKMKEHTTMVVLSLNEDGKIHEIREVYNVYQKTLN